MSWFSRSDASTPQGPPARAGRAPSSAGYGQLPASPAPPPRHAAVPPAYIQPAHEAYSRHPQAQQPHQPEKRALASANQFHLPTRSSGGAAAAGRGGNASTGGGRFAVVEAPSASHALSNRIVLSESDWAGTPYVAIKGQFLYSTM